MSVNHFANINIDPLLDAYANEIDADSVQFKNLILDDIDVSGLTKATLYTTPDNQTTITSTKFNTNKNIESDVFNTVNLETTILNVIDESECASINLNHGIWNPKNIVLDTVQSITSFNVINFVNVIYGQLSQYDSFWRYTKTYGKQTLVNSVLKPVTTVRLNIYATAVTDTPSSPIYFGFDIYDSDILPSTAKIISLDGSCCNIQIESLDFDQPARWITTLKDCVIGPESISVRYGEVGLPYYTSGKPLYFYLDISYTT